MGKDGELRVMDDGPAVSGRLTRREMVQRLLSAAVAGAAWPSVSSSHSILKHFANASILEHADAKIGAADWAPVFLNARQNEALIALSESIVPGSTKAQVNRFIDLLLSADTPESQRKFVASVAAFDTESQSRLGQPFASLTVSQREALLKVASAMEAESEDQGLRIRLSEHFENLKDWISGAYYSSEEGMKELGWTGDYAHESFPGCEHADGHL